MLPRLRRIDPSKEAKHRKMVIDNPEDYAYEHKLDGWGCVAYVEGRDVILESKKGTKYLGFPNIRKELRSLGFDSAVFDGEIVAFDAQGNIVFDLIKFRREPIYYFVFDILFLGQQPAKDLPFLERKKILQMIFQGSTGPVKYLEHFTADTAEQLIEKIKRNNWEGVVAKRKDAPYDPDLQGNWVKIYNPAYIPVFIKRRKQLDKSK
jgi:bifunctional non-homologous end joining protein LigD